MTGKARRKDRWSDELARRLVASLSRQQLNKLWRAATNPDAVANSPSTYRQLDLLQAARSDRSLQRRIMRAWRGEHQQVVDAAELVNVESSAEQCERMLSQFSPEEIVLELITDLRDDGWQTAEWVAASIPSKNVRREMRNLLDELSRADVPPDARVFRIVIFGGHQRDESKMTRRLFHNSIFDVRWKTCEKSHGNPDDKTLNEAMSQADAVIFVTTMISHNVMRMVKRQAREKGIPSKAIDKATDRHLDDALNELFPNEDSTGQ